MKLLVKKFILILIAVCCVDSYGMETDTSLGGAPSNPLTVDYDSDDTRPTIQEFQGDSKDETLRKRDNPEAAVKSALKKSKGSQKGTPKSVRISPRVDREEQYNGVEQIVADNFLLQRNRSFETYKEHLETLFEDAEASGGVAVGGVTREQALKNVYGMKKQREYAKETFFGDYRICHPKTKEIMGGVFFADMQGESPELEGLFQIQFYIISKYQGQRIGYTVLMKILEVLINPNLGKPIQYLKKTEGSDHKKELQECVLKGLVCKMDFLNPSPCADHGMIASFHKAGFGGKLCRKSVIFCLPPDCFPVGPPLEHSEVVTLVLISKSIKDCRDEEMKAKFLKLASVMDPYTSISALNILYSEFVMRKNELEAVVSPATIALKMDQIQKNVYPPLKLVF